MSSTEKSEGLTNLIDGSTNGTDSLKDVNFGEINALAVGEPLHLKSYASGSILEHSSGGG